MSAPEILWDEYGIPHIFAPDHRGLFYAYGYAQMEAHGELLARLYAQGRGRAAEFYGAAWLEDDRWVRTNGIPRRAARWARQQSAEFLPLLHAFAAGLNASAAAQGDHLSAAARRVLPFTLVDVLAHTMRVIHFDWLASRQRVARSESNGWAIGPSKSASGHAMLLSNSHLQWGDRHTCFEVQLTAPGVTSYGAVWVGFPVLRQCFTEYHAARLCRAGAGGRRIGDCRGGPGAGVRHPAGTLGRCGAPAPRVAGPSRQRRAQRAGGDSHLGSESVRRRQRRDRERRHLYAVVEFSDPVRGRR